MFHLRRHRRTSGEVDKSKNLHDKTSHLYEISKAPKDTWQILADTAYMELVKANNQGELLALEIGIHANATVLDKSKKDGGLKKYAYEIGRGKDSVEQWSKAGFVYSSLTETYRLKELHEKTSHLYEISKAPQHTWQLLADTAYMELVKANNQGELLALEIGIHALATVNDKTKKGGGVRAYAAEIGKGENSVSEWVKAADVFMFLSRTSGTNELNEKTKHLYEISKAPQHTWQLLADLLIKCDWSVKDTQAAVNRVKSINLLDWMKADFKEIATTPAIVLSLSM